MITILAIVAVILLIAIALKRIPLTLVDRRLAVWIADRQRAITINRLARSTAQYVGVLIYKDMLKGRTKILITVSSTPEAVVERVSARLVKAGYEVKIIKAGSISMELEVSWKQPE